ncbi:MAG: hypothetical protein ACLS37_14070 [Alistipes sp.]
MDGYLTQHRNYLYAGLVRPSEYRACARRQIEYRTLCIVTSGTTARATDFTSAPFRLRTGRHARQRSLSKADYVDGQVEYAPSDIRITSNIIPDFYISIIKDSTILIHTDQLTTLKPMPPVE